MKNLLALLPLALLPSLARADVIDVQLIGTSFVPAHVTIDLGDTVRWTYVSGASHTVHEGTGPFPDGTEAFGRSVEALFPVFEVTFDAALLSEFPRANDVYLYYCIPHWPNMNGSVTVLGGTAGPSVCNGDGGDQLGCTDCPCSNEATAGTVGGCLNSVATSARLTALGDTSVSLPSGATEDLRFSLNGAPPSAFCILNSGDAVAPLSMANPCFGLDSGAQSAAYDGLRCAVQNTRRHGGRSADALGVVGTATNPWGGEGGPPAGVAQAGGSFVSGQTRVFQVVHRDDPLASCMRGLNTSQAVVVTFTP